MTLAQVYVAAPTQHSICATNSQLLQSAVSVISGERKLRVLVVHRDPLASSIPYTIGGKERLLRQAVIRCLILTSMNCARGLVGCTSVEIETREGLGVGYVCMRMCLPLAARRQQGPSMRHSFPFPSPPFPSSLEPHHAYAYDGPYTFNDDAGLVMCDDAAQ